MCCFCRSEVLSAHVDLLGARVTCSLCLSQVVAGLLVLGQEASLQEAAEAAEGARRPPRLSVDGCMVLQALLAMPQSACRAVTDEVVALEAASVGFVAADGAGTRVLEALLKVRCTNVP